jgi:HEPN domain-containing protein
VDVEQLDTLRQWVRKAEEDWSAAEYLLAAASDVLYRPACFHAQQSAEKYLKAVLIVRGIGFPRTHNLEQLLLLLEEAGARLDGIDADQVGVLTPHAVTSRYPDDFELVDAAQAHEAVALACGLRLAVRQVLPAEALV